MKKPSFNKERPLSWSSFSGFEWNSEEWYDKYCVHGLCTRPKDGLPAFCAVLGAYNHACPVIQTSVQMEFGKMIGERIAADPAFLPQLQRRSVYEQEFKCKLGKIPLVGYADSYEPHTHLEEYKTGVKAWDQKRADEHGQITMYLLMAYLLYGVKPESVDCQIHWMPTMMNGDYTITFTNETEPVIHTFKTRRTTRQILEFGAEINAMWAKMEAYCNNHV